MGAPVIGVTAGTVSDAEGNMRVALSQTYVAAVLRAGGIPVILPAELPEDLLETVRGRLDGLLFTGGPDVEPSLFQGEPHAEVYGIDPCRDSLEIHLVQAAVREKMPLLGICRGIQVINIAMGGGLYTHIPDQLAGALKHDYYPDYPRSYEAHPVQIEPGSRLEAIIGSTTANVNSLHHQGLSRLAPGLTPVAYSPDGLVEAVEVYGHPFGLGVQFHPEGMPDSPQMQAIFRAFIQAAGS